MLAQAAISTHPVISTRHVSPTVSKQNPLIEAMHMMGATTSFPSETEIFGEGEGADYAYQIVSGGVRTYKILKDGRRQVGGFYVPGGVQRRAIAQDDPARGRHLYGSGICETFQRP